MFTLTAMWRLIARGNGELAVLAGEAADGRVAGTVSFGEGSLGLADLAEKAMALSAILTELYEAKAAAEARAISCRKGCGACCRQPVPISAAEAFMLERTVSEFPALRRTRTRRQFTAALTAAQEGLPQGGWFSEGPAYFRLGIACPFLVRESCSIHPARPAACREHLVTTSPAHCAEFPSPFVRMLPMEAPVQAMLSALCAELLGAAPEMIPLVCALEWAEAHREESGRRWEAGYLLRKVAGHMPSPA